MAETPGIEFVKCIAISAGRIVKEAFNNRAKHVDYKLSVADLVTETDVEVENHLKGLITEKFPSHKFICEESEDCHQELTDEPTWIIDPVDGTTNFVHGFPLVAISIGFYYKRNAELGVIYNPILDEIFFASRGNGAHMTANASQENGTTRTTTTALRVSPERNLLSSIVCTGYSTAIAKKISVPEERRKLNEESIAAATNVVETSCENHKALLLTTRDIRRMGSCACDMAWTAAGRCDAMAEIGVKEWDVAAGVLIVAEAGGYVCNYDGTTPVDISKRNVIAASNKELALELCKTLKTPKCDMRKFFG